MTRIYWQMPSITPLLFILFVVFSSVAFAFPTYDGCESCHGVFDGDDDYTSLQDQTDWSKNLMQGHLEFVSGCDSCHKTGGRGEVFLNLSSDGLLSKSCVGCHGRDEDVTNNCVGGGGTQVECGSGAGLRRQHELNVSAGTCAACHSGEPTPVGEQTAPYNYGLTGVDIENACDADGTESQYGLTGLDNDGNGQRDGDDPDCGAPPINTPPTQPGALSASAVTSNSATVSWGASSDVDGDQITYQVEYRQSGGGLWTPGGSTTGTSQPLSGLNSNTSYDVKVTPNDGTEDGIQRETQNLFQTTAVNTPPTQPGALSASAVTSSSATVSWGASSDVDGDQITYQVEYRQNGALPWTSGGNTTLTSRPLSGLNSNQSYDVRVTPNDGTEDGTERMALSLFLTDAVNTPPTQPGALSASAVTTSSAMISWGASSDVDGDSITYRVEYRHNGTAPWTSGGSTSGTSQPLSGLDSKTSYDVRVIPNDGTEDGTERMALNLFQTDNTPPTQPGALSASVVTTSSATVSWGASSDADGDSITYRVEYRHNSTAPWTSGGSTSGTSQPLSGLDAEQAYDVRVTPNDGTDDGPDRTTLNLFTTETPNTPPTQPGTLSASAVTANSATVSWGASSDVDGDTITYQVDYRRNGDTTWTSSGSTNSLSQSLNGLDSSQAYDVRIIPNDGTDDGPDHTALDLFQTEVDTDAIFKDSFEGN